MAENEDRERRKLHRFHTGHGINLTVRKRKNMKKTNKNGRDPRFILKFM